MSLPTIFKSCLLLLLAFFTSHHLTAQCIGDIELESQAQVDSFPLLYGCSILQGDLEITGADIISLDSLYMIDTIMGHLEIKEISGLKTLSGLENLVYIGRDLVIEDMDGLKTLSGLGSLVYIGNDVEVHNNDSLLNFGGLESVQIIKSDFYSEGNPLLNDLSAIDSNIYIGSSIEINDNVSLSVCNEYWICKNISCGVDYDFFDNAPGCKDLGEGLIGCGCVIGEDFRPIELEITSQEQIDGLAEKYKDCPFTIFRMTIDGSSIKELDSLYFLESLREFNLQGCDSLESLRGLENLMQVALFEIRGNGLLSDVSMIKDDIVVSEELRIEDNMSLNSCDFIWICNVISCLNSVDIKENGDDCDLYKISPNCPCISDAFYIDIGLCTQAEVDSFPQVYAACGGQIRNLILEDGDMTNLDSLYQVVTVLNELEIRNCDRLKDLSGLQNLFSVGQDFRIWENDSLINLNDLDSFRFVGDGVLIRNNEQLVDVSGIDSSFKIGQSLAVIDNQNLSICGVDWVCSYFENGGQIIMFSNKVECNGPIDVWESCDCNLFEDEIDFELYDQGDVDSLRIRWLACPRIIEDIEIRGDSITNLDSLSFLTEMTGRLEIINCGSLTDISGVSNLNKLEELTIGGNDLLTSISAFKDTLSVDERIEVVDNPMLDLCDVPFICKHINDKKEFIINNNGSDCNSTVEVLGQCACGSGLNYASIEIETQSEVDSLGLYLRTCPFNIWSLEIRNDGSDPITNLDSLIYLDSVFHELRILGDPSLEDISALKSLKFIGTNLELQDDFGNDTLSGFDSLTYVGGYVKIDESNFSDISSINATVYIKGDVVIEDNSNLKLCNTAWICNYLTTSSGTLSVWENDSLCNDVFEIVNGCGCPSDIQAKLNVTLSSQQEVESFAYIYKNCPFEIENLWIGPPLGDDDDDDDDDDGFSISSLDSLYCLDSIYGGLDFISNNRLKSLSGLENLKYVGEHLLLFRNHLLSNLNGLNGLTHIGGRLSVSTNFNLRSLEGLGNLTRIGGNFRMRENFWIKDFKGLEALEEIGGDFDMEELYALRTFAGLGSLRNIYEDFDIERVPSLLNFGGIENLRMIGGNFSLIRANKLNSISAMYQLDSLGGSLRIGRNQSLSVCNLGWICEHLEDGRPSLIYSNKPNCHTKPGILSQCACEEMIVLPDPDGIYRAGNLIESLGDQIMIQSGIYDAPNVLLKPGFEVPKGTSLLVVSKGCD